jgi:gamma-glutamyltranspeptidase/glutathione hydrolase
MPLYATEIEPYPSRIAIATGHYLATQTAVEILNEGGNAFDAAVAVAAVLGVVQPYGSGLGGGGFWLLHDAKTNNDIFIDSREIAPQKAQNKQLLQNTPALTIGIPGEPAAYEFVAKKYGQLPLKKLLTPAIYYAKNGFAIDDRYLYWLNTRKAELLKNTAARKIFFDESESPQPKIWLVQTDLAKSLTLLATKGAKEFYQGTLAQKIVAAVNKENGNWTLHDLKSYQLKIRNPIKEQFKDFSLTTIGEPSAGGYEMIAMLQGLQGYPNWKDFSSTEQIHLFAELMRRANSERKYYADPDFEKEPVPNLAKDRFYPTKTQAINLNKATPIKEGEHTTFFVIVDKKGNRAAVNLTLNDMFGSTIMVSGAGIILNNELTDFTPTPENKNQLQPGKRPLSSMSPSFFQDKCRLIITGTPGGKRIPTMQFLVLTALLQNNSLKTALEKPRFHQSFLPDILEIENQGFSEQIIKGLQEKGHTIKPIRQFGDMQAVMYDRCTQEVTAASDPRGVGSAVVF